MTPMSVSDVFAPAVIPVLIGPLQVLLAILPGLALAMLGALISVFKPRVMVALLKLVWRLKIPVGIGVVCLVGTVWAARTMWPTNNGAVGAEIRGTDWPMIRGGLHRRGWAGDGEGPSAGKQNWAWKQPDQAFFASPAVVGNRVYIVSAEMDPFGQSGTIYCFDADTGGVVWKASPKGYRPTFSSPVVLGEYLVVGEGLHLTKDARVFCLSLKKGSEGKVLWEHRTRSHVECTPIIADGRVYVGAGDDGYHCLELASGKLLWHAPADKYKDAETSLAVYDGKVYAGQGVGGQSISVIDGKNGTDLGRMKMPYPVFGLPSIANGKLYVGLGTGDYVNSAQELGQKPAGEVRCIDIAKIGKDGYQGEWTYSCPETILGAVAVADKQIYFASRDGWLYCLNENGTLMQKWDAHAPLISSPAVTKKHVYIVAKSGMLYAIDRAKFTEVWKYRLGTGGRKGQPEFISAPAVARGKVFVGTQFDGFICAGQPTAPKPMWVGNLGGAGASGNPDDNPLPDVGNFVGNFPQDMQGEKKETHVTAPAATVGTNIVVPFAGGPHAGIVCLPGNVKPEAVKPIWAIQSKAGVHLSPAIVNGVVYFVDAGDSERALSAVTLADGKPQWRLPVDPSATGVFVATSGEIYIQDKPEALSCVDASGKVLWTHTIGKMDLAPTPVDLMLVAAIADPPSLALLDGPTGRELWRVPLEHRPRTTPVIDGGMIWVGTEKGLAARTLLAGEAPGDWKPGAGNAASELALGRESIAYVTELGNLLVVRRSNGTKISSIPGAILGINPIVSRDTVFFAGKTGMMRLSMTDEKAEAKQWADTSWLGAPTSPMIVSNGGIYLGMEGWGFVKLGGNQ